MEHDLLRNRMAAIMERTKSAEGLMPAAWWVGDTAGKRKVSDDINAGRLAWASARRDAKNAIAALDNGDHDLAQACAWGAMEFYVIALEAQIRPEGWEALGRPSQPRGRRPKK